MTCSEIFDEIPMKDLSSKMWHKMTDAIANQDDIILDRTNLTSKGRKKFLSKLPTSYTKIAKVFQVPSDVLTDRLENRANQTGKVIPTNVIMSMIDSYVEPTLDEFDVIDYI